MKKKKGSALILTLVVVLLLMVLGTSLITVSASTYNTEVANDNINKLNMMTESGMDVALAQVKKATSSSSLVNIMGLKSYDDSITCNVIFHSGTYVASTSSYIAASGNYTIESKAYSANNSRTIRVSFTYVASTASGTVPTDSLLFINGDTLGSNFSCGNVNGNIFVNGNLFIDNGIINGNVLIKGDLEFDGGTKVNGYVQVDHNLVMPQGNISGAATIGGNATFSGGAPKIGGNLYYKGITTVSGGNLNQFVPMGAILTTTYTPINFNSDTLPLIVVPTIIQNPEDV